MMFGERENKLKQKFQLKFDKATYVQATYEIVIGIHFVKMFFFLPVLYILISGRTTTLSSFPVHAQSI